MKKKFLSLLLAAALTAAMLVGCGDSSATPAESESTKTTKATEAAEEPSGAAVPSESGKGTLKIGVLSVLNITEEKYKEMEDAKYNVAKILFNVKDEGKRESKVTFYDNLGSMQMALAAGEIDMMQIPKSTADYLISRNDQMEIHNVFGPIEDLEEEEQDLWENLTRTGFAFMMREDSQNLRDQFDAVLDELKADGTLNKITKEYITGVVEGDEPKAVEFENKGDETIKVAVTGDLPPMDYVAADGSFAGFNTALLAEIGKRLGKKIEMKQVDTAARAISLSSQEVDVVFWARVNAQKNEEEEVGGIEELDEELIESASPEEKSRMDIPEGTIVTDSYFVDRIVPVSLKKQ